jgi:hypothetical protein
MISDGTVAKTEEEVLEDVTKESHPCVGMEELL